MDISQRTEFRQYNYFIFLKILFHFKIWFDVPATQMFIFILFASAEVSFEGASSLWVSLKFLSMQILACLNIFNLQFNSGLKKIWDIRYSTSYTDIKLRLWFKRWSFSLRISSANLTKSAGNCRFDHIYWRKILNGKLHFWISFSEITANNELIISAVTRPASCQFITKNFITFEFQLVEFRIISDS